jgi:hypothetical protein
MVALGVPVTHKVAVQAAEAELRKLAESCPQCSNEILGTHLLVTPAQYHCHEREWHSDRIRDFYLLPSIGAA